MTTCPKCKKCLITKYSAVQTLCDGCFFKKENSKSRQKDRGERSF